MRTDARCAMVWFTKALPRFERLLKVLYLILYMM